MPIGKQSKSQSSNTPQHSGTSYVAQQPKPKDPPIVVFPTLAPPSYEKSEADEFAPNILLKPTQDVDLDYFYAIAAGEIPQRLPSSSSLVMNLFRTTQTHLFPIAERIALGSTLNAPYYSLQSGPSSKSVDEFNLLTITRRSPARARWTTACISEIEPRIDLLASGLMIISRITIDRGSSLSELYDLTWEASRGRYTVWRNIGSAVEPKIEIVCEGWETLDNSHRGGIIRVSSHNLTYA